MLIILACNPEQNSHNSPASQFSNEKELHAQPFSLEGDLGEPIQILLKDSLLIVSEATNDYLLYFYNINNGELLNKIARVGKGPNEFLSPISIALSQDGNLDIYSRRQFKFFKYHLQADLSLKEKSLPVQFSSDNQMVYSIENGFMAFGLYGKGRFCISNIRGQDFRYFGDYPDIAIENSAGRRMKVDDNTMAMLFQSKVAIKSDYSGFAVVNSNVGIVEGYRLDDSIGFKLNTFSISNSVKLKSTSSGNRITAQLSDKSPRGFLDVASTEDYIYALYSGRSVKEYPYQTHLGTTLMVFDWDINPIVKYSLDEAVRCIAIDSTKKRIYGISERGGVPEVVFFKY